jgi:hypothetical protein
VTTVLCPRCETPFDTVHSAAQHAWKSTDDDHDDLDTLDEAIGEVVENGKPPESAGGGDGASNGTDTVATDGAGLGLQGPPEPEQHPDVDEEDDDELDCPSCGEPTGATPDEIDPQMRYKCTECDTVVEGAELV